MKKKQILSLLTIMTLIIGLFAACGKATTASAVVENYWATIANGGGGRIIIKM